MEDVVVEPCFTMFICRRLFGNFKYVKFHGPLLRIQLKRVGRLKRFDILFSIHWGLPKRNEIAICFQFVASNEDNICLVRNSAVYLKLQLDCELCVFIAKPNRSDGKQYMKKYCCVTSSFIWLSWKEVNVAWQIMQYLFCIKIRSLSCRNWTLVTAKWNECPRTARFDFRAVWNKFGERCFR